MSILGSKKDDPPNSFEKGMIRKVGSGLHTFLLSDPWIKNIPLKIMFCVIFFSFSCLI